MRLIERVIAENEDGKGSRSTLLYLGPRGRRYDSRSLLDFLPLIVLGTHRGWGDRWFEFTAYPLHFGTFGRQHNLRLGLPLTQKDGFVSWHLGMQMVCFTGGYGKRSFRAHRRSLGHVLRGMTEHQPA